MLDFRKYGTTDQILFASNYTESRNKKGLKLQVRAYVNKEVNGWLGGTYYHGISETYRKSISFSTPETGTNQYNILGFLAGYSHVGKKGLILESIFFLGKDINIPDLEASYLDFNLQLNIGYSF